MTIICTLYDPIDTIFAMEKRECSDEKPGISRRKECSSESSIIKMELSCRSVKEACLSDCKCVRYHTVACSRQATSDLAKPVTPIQAETCRSASRMAAGKWEARQKTGEISQHLHFFSPMWVSTTAPLGQDHGQRGHATQSA